MSSASKKKVKQIRPDNEASSKLIRKKNGHTEMPEIGAEGWEEKPKGNFAENIWDVLSW